MEGHPGDHQGRRRIITDFLDRATFEFSLPEEQEEYDVYRQAWQMRNALLELRKVFRDERKYDGPTLTEETFFAILEDEDVSLDA